ncbi:MAG TPA: nucleotidyltransferase domain-containing protein [Allosphingosinicella sp.]|nr:nucleotidyltransferase domain-containing protein [Allosphingosinicella sp.]
MAFVELTGEQIRQLINTEQTYEAFRRAQAERERYRGAMAWKRVRGREYLYRKRSGTWKSLGPRGPDTVRAYESFHSGRPAARERLKSLDKVIREQAPVNRAMRLGRVPWPAARLLRRLESKRVLGQGISVVGTNALFAYERMAGTHFAGSEVTTTDIDLLFDARDRLRLLAPDLQDEGLQGILRDVDETFEMLAPGSFRAVNAAGFIVDLIKPMPRAPARSGERARIGDDPADMTAAEIEGLVWLQNSPQVEQVVVDERGFPLRIAAPDPRAFALHKLWLSERPDRDPLKRRRDSRQAAAVAAVVVRYLPQLRFEDEALQALPESLRARISELTGRAAEFLSGPDSGAW